MKRYITLFYFLSICTIGWSQSVLDTYITQGLEQNQQFIREQLNAKVAIEDLKESKSLFFPDISFNASYTLSEGGRTIGFPVGDLLNPVYKTLNELTATNQFPENIANVDEALLPNNFHDTKIRVIQPLLNTDIYYGYKAKKAQVSLVEEKTKAFENALIFKIKEAYYSYLKILEQQKVLENTRVVVKELVRVNSKLVKYEVATKEVWYNAKAQLYTIDASLASVEKGVHAAKNFFNFLLNRDLEETIEVDLDINPQFFDQKLTSLQETAVAARSEIRQLRNGIKATDFELKKNKGYLIPDIAIAVEMGYQGFDYSFGNEQDYYLANFSLSWPLFKGGGNKAKTRRSAYQKQQLKAEMNDLENTIRLEVSNAYYRYSETIRIHSAATAVLKNEQENFKIINGKYRQSQAILVEFNEARNNLTTAELNEVISKYDILIAYADLQRTLQKQD